MKLYKTDNKKGKIVFYIILFLVIILPFIFLQPKISSKLFSFKRKFLWDQFITDSVKAKKIDAQKFWQLREFYYPGYITFERNGISDKKTYSFLKQFKLIIQSGKYFYPFLIYKSDKFNSLEAFVNIYPIDLLLGNLHLDNKKVILNNNSQIIYLENNKQAVIIFVKPLEEMKKTNGYFDYADRDQEFTKYKLWFSISLINLD